MATLIQAIQAYGPKLILRPTAQLDEIADWMAMRTGVNKSEALMLLQELNEAILYHNRRGTPVKLPGIGIFSPSIKRNGNYRINVRVDSLLKKGINTTNIYIGQMSQREHIGFTNEEFKVMWDAVHPNDPLELDGNGTGS